MLDPIAQLGHWATDARHCFTRAIGPDINALEFIGQTRWALAGADVTEPAWSEHIRQMDAHEPFVDFNYCSNASGVRYSIRVTGAPFYCPKGCCFRGYRGSVWWSKCCNTFVPDIEGPNFLSRWTADQKHRVIDYTASSYLTSFAPGRILGMVRWEQPGIDAESEKWANYIRNVSHRRPIHNFIYPLTAKKGRLAWVKVNAAPHYIDGTFYGYQGTSLCTLVT